MTKNSSNSIFVAAGLMSGTSMDGIDSALIMTDGEAVIKELGTYSLSYGPQFKLLLKSCERAVWENKGDIAKARHSYAAILKSHKLDESITFDKVIEKSTDLHAQTIQGLLTATNYQIRDIDVIGYHGQTLFHSPTAHLTIQAGDGQRLADKSGIAVVYDFRSNDIRHGGQGAPLAPLYHQALAYQSGIAPVVIVNCGGIANVTIIGTKNEELYAFDCGPGNTLIDRFVQLKIGENMDKDGHYGSKGQINLEILQALKYKALSIKNQENYLAKKPPKSLDVNDITLIAEAQALSLEDGCATLEAFTAECIVDSFNFLPIPIPKTWILAGGGWKNKVITAELELRLKYKLGDDLRFEHADQVGWNSQSMEAQVFAYLAVRSIRKMSLSLPNTTGISKPLSGGELAIPFGNAEKASSKMRLFLQNNL